jgi:hypothetical protein
MRFHGAISQKAVIFNFIFNFYLRSYMITISCVESTRRVCEKGNRQTYTYIRWAWSEPAISAFGSSKIVRPSTARPPWAASYFMQFEDSAVIYMRTKKHSDSYFQMDGTKAIVREFFKHTCLYSPSMSSLFPSLHFDFKRHEKCSTS